MRTVTFGLAFIVVSIILGAFAAHSLKDIFTADRLNAFKTGTQYLMYNGLGVLALSGIKSMFSAKIFNSSVKLIITGTLLFSLSIFTLNIIKHNELICNTQLIGLLTPMGGILMILGWSILLINSFKQTV